MRVVEQRSAGKRSTWWRDDSRATPSAPWACLDEAEKLATAIDLRRLVMRVGRVRAALDGTASAKQPGPEAARPANRPEARAPAFTLTREGDYWTVAASTVTTRIKHARGMQILAELVAAPASSTCSR